MLQLTMYEVMMLLVVFIMKGSTKCFA
uniref:Uncharacterized protein n=1 Tax=Arundo donax TaxID=35708 RepID=A0A0A8Z8B2_ARUDO